MILALGTALIVAVALLFDLVAPGMIKVIRRAHHRRRRAPELAFAGDPGRELRAEQRARELLRSCVGHEEWAMYRELGFIRMWGARNAYLIYPHQPIVSYVPATGRLLHEYCVTFPDHTRPYGSPRLPDSDDVLAKWMALSGDEGRLIASANMHMVGRQMDAQQLKRDIWRLSRWERARMDHEAIGA